MSEDGILGVRVPDGTAVYEYPVGGYGRAPFGDDPDARLEWAARPPDERFPSGAWLSKHEIVEHDDGTITVEPSILMLRGDGVEYHGWLRSGVWTT